MNRFINKKLTGTLCAVFCAMTVLYTSIITPFPSVKAEELTYNPESTPIVDLDFTGDSPTGNAGGNGSALFNRNATNGITMYFNGGNVYRWLLIKRASEASSASWNIPAGSYFVEYETKITSKGGLADDEAVNDAVEVRLAYNEDLNSGGYAKDGTDTEHFLGEKLVFQSDREKHSMLVTFTEKATRLNICLFNGEAGPKLAIQSIKIFPATPSEIEVDFGGKKQTVNTKTTDTVIAPYASGVSSWKLGEDKVYNVGDEIPVADLVNKAIDGKVALTPVYAYTYDPNSTPVVDLDFTGNSPTGNAGGNGSALFNRNATNGITMYFNGGNVYRWLLIKRASEASSASWNIPAGSYFVEYETKITSKGGLADDEAVNDAVEVRLAYNEDLKTNGYVKDGTDTEHFLGEKLVFQSDREKHSMLVTLTEKATRLNICLFNGEAGPQLAIQSIKFYPVTSAVFQADFAGTKQFVNSNTTENIVAPEAFGVTGWALDGTTYNVGDNIPIEKLKENLEGETVYLKPVLSNENIYKKIDFESDFKAGGSFSGGLYQVNNGHGDTAYGKSLAARSKSNDPKYVRGIIFNNGSSKLALPQGNYIIRYEYKAVRDANGWSSNSQFTPYPDDYKMQFMLTDGSENANVDFTGVNMFDFEEISSIEGATYASGEKGSWKHGMVEIEVSEQAAASGKNYLFLNSAYILSTIYLDNVTIYKVPSNNIKVDFAGSEQIVNKVTETEIAAPSALGVNGWVLDGVTYKVGDKIPVSVLADKAVNERVSLTPVLSNENIHQKIDFESNFNAGNNTGFSGGLYGVNSNHGDKAYGNSLAARYASNDPSYVRGVIFNNGTDKMTLPVGDYVIRFEYKAVRDSNGWSSNKNFSPYPQAYKMQFMLTDGKANANVDFTNTNMFSFDSIADIESSAYGSNTASAWMHGATEITVTPDDVTEGKNYLFLNSSHILSTVYIDNVVIYKNPVPKKTVNFNSNGGSKCPSIRTEIGNFVEYPVPTKDGYNFAGWYSDNKTFKKPASKLGLDKDVTYYAKWLKHSEGLILDFETPNKCGGEFGSGFFSYVYSGDSEHGKALLYDNNTFSVGRYTMLNQNGATVSIEKGTIYKISFDYYVEKLPRDGEIIMDFAVNMNLKNPLNPSGTRLTNKNLLAGVSNTSTDIVGKWQRVELVCVTSEKIKDGRLGIYIGGRCNPAEIIFDNIKFEPTAKDDIVLEYKIPLTGQTETLIGKKGQKFDTSLIPVLNDSRYNFEGWYAKPDYREDSKINWSTRFPDRSYTVYGKTSIKDEIHVGYDDYPDNITQGQLSKSIMSIEKGFSYDGDGYALCIDNIEGTQTQIKYSLMFSEKKPVLIEANKSYAVTAHYYIVEKTPSATIQFQVSKSSKNDFWINKATLSSLNNITSIKLKGKWHSKTIVVDVPEDAGENIALNFDMKLPKGTKMYIDDIVVQEIPKGYSAVYFEMDSGVAPYPMIVKTNSTVKLPTPKNIGSNKEHIGWYLNGIFTDNKEMQVATNTLLKAAVVTKKIEEDFENFKFLEKKDFGLAMIDGDWEIYNGKNNNIANVKNGSYSLHRIGKEPEPQGYSLFYNRAFSDNIMNFSLKYKLSMWVKVENPVHTRGAIELSSLTTPTYTWATTGTKHSIAAIKDIADGQWHKVEYTFKAEALYFAIYVPGNLSIYIDDMTLEFAGLSAVESQPVTGYEEYIPVLLNSKGEYVVEDTDKSKLTPYELVKYTGATAEDSSNTIPLTIIIIIAVSALILTAGAVTTVIIIKRKKSRGANK